MRIKLDESLPSNMARLFQEAGHDISTVLEQGLGGVTDESLATRTAEEGRVLVTLDVGFGDLRRYPPQEHAGIIVLRLQRHDFEHLMEMARRLISLIEDESAEGKLWVVSESRVRIRE